MRFILALLLFAGSLARAQIISSAAITEQYPPAYRTAYSSEEYKVVPIEWLKAFYPKYLAELARINRADARGPVWVHRFQCNAFVDFFQLYAQIEYAKESPTLLYNGPESLAIASVWYYIGGDANTAHAAIFVITDIGAFYIDPQESALKIKTLTLAETASIYLRKF